MYGSGDWKIAKANEEDKNNLLDKYVLWSKQI